MRVHEIMNKAVNACHPEDSLAEATAVMWKLDSDSLPVIDWQDQIAGLITARDVEAALRNTNRPAPEVQVSDAMSHTIVSCSPEDDIHEAVGLIRKFGCRRLPVVNKDGKLIGIFSLTALLDRRKEGDDLGISESELLELSYGDL